GDDGVRPAVLYGADRIVGRGRREAEPPQLGRSGGEPDRRRVLLDGREFYEVRRERGEAGCADGERYSGGLARADCDVRAAADVCELRDSGARRCEVAGSPGQLHGGSGGAAGVPAAGREGVGRLRRLQDGEDAAGEYGASRRTACVAAT